MNKFIFSDKKVRDLRLMLRISITVPERLHSRDDVTTADEFSISGSGKANDLMFAG
jgi:hypothetical protein